MSYDYTDYLEVGDSPAGRISGLDCTICIRLRNEKEVIFCQLHP